MDLMSKKTLFKAEKPHCELLGFENLRLKYMHNALHNISSQVIEPLDLNGDLASIPPIYHNMK